MRLLPMAMQAPFAMRAGAQAVRAVLIQTVVRRKIHEAFSAQISSQDWRTCIGSNIRSLAAPPRLRTAGRVRARTPRTNMRKPAHSAGTQPKSSSHAVPALRREHFSGAA